MKKMLLFATLTIVFIIGASAQIVTNGDFETGDFTGWEKLADNALVQGADDMGDPTQLIDGNYSCYKNWGSGDIISQVLQLEAGVTYTLTFESFRAWDWIYLYARIYDAANDTALIAETETYLKDTLTAGYLEFTPTVDSVKLLFHKWADSPGRVGIDNVVVEAVEEPADTTNSDTTNTMISELELTEFKLAQYPSGEFRVTNLRNIESLSVFSISGQLVKQIPEIRAREITFNIRRQPQGLYIIRMKDVQGNVSVKKVINKYH